MNFNKNDDIIRLNDENIINNNTSLITCITNDLEAVSVEEHVVVNVKTANSFDPLSPDEIIYPSDYDSDSFDELNKVTPSKKRYQGKLIRSRKIEITPKISNKYSSSVSLLKPDIETTLDRLDNFNISYDTPPPPMRFEAIAASRMHQNDPSLASGGGVQCVVLATSAVVFSVAKNRDIFTTDDMDTILIDGNSVYVRLLNNSSPRYLDPEEVSRNFIVGDIEFSITQPEWVANGLYPFDPIDNDNARNQLKEILENAFNSDEYDSTTDGFIFTFQHYTISFWQKHETYLLFNSHPVDINGIRNDDEANFNKARLFHVPDLEILACLLLIAGQNNVVNNQYSIHRVRILSWRPVEPTRIMIENNSSNVSTVSGDDDVEMILHSTSIVTENGSKDGKRKRPTRNRHGLKKQKLVTPDVIIIDKDDLSTTTVANGDDVVMTLLSTSIVTEIDSINEKKKRGRPKKVTRCTKKQKLVSPGITLANNVDLDSVLTIANGDDIEKTLLNTNIVTEKGSKDEKKKRGRPKKVTRGFTKQKLATSGVINIKNVESASISSLTSNDEVEMALHNTSTLTENGSKDEKKKRGRPIKATLNPKKQKLVTPGVIDIKNVELTSVSSVTSGDEIEMTLQGTSTVTEADSKGNNRKQGRPKKVTRGRTTQKLDAQADANKKYQFKKPKALSDAKIKYNKTHSKVITRAVSKFRANNPEANKEATSKFKANNPEANKEATSKFKANNPEANKKATSKFKANNPEANNEAVSKFRKNKPEINKKVNKEAASKFRAKHQESNIVYNQTTRKIPLSLRNVGMIGELSGDLLNRVQLFTLKNISLNSNDVYVCPQCKSKLFYEEKGREQWCCGKGRYNVLNLPPLTDTFYDDPVFLQRSRAYNNLFAFSALGVSGDCEQLPGPGFIKIQGRTYHRIFDLSYTKSTNPLGFYVYDDNERYNEARQNKLNREIVIQITNYVNEHNPFIDHFKRLSLEESDDAFLMFKRTTRSEDGPNIGSMVSNTEVAAIISSNSEEITPRTVVVWKIGEAAAHTIPEFNELYETLHYTLLYPHGTPGYFLNKLDNTGVKLTQLKYYRCLMLSEYRFAEMGRLSEEWLVDMFCRVQDERINYLEKVQKPLRTAPLNELTDGQDNHIYNDIGNDETILGEGRIVPGRIYLPNTFTGGPRYMQTKYMDAIALVNRLGRPSYFLTFTCNPKWPEILESRRNDCYSSPVITARVFTLKLQQLLNDLRSGRYLGASVYIMHVIEFQKRGLPHAHICFRVEGGGPLQNTDIDKIVRADIPSPDEANGRLRELVLKHMIHGPCGEGLRENIPCWNAQKRKCERYFPKLATDTTFVDPRGFVNLKRNPANITSIKYRNRDLAVNDLWVVPYNAAILLKYDAHINLEISSTRKIVKYLFKYITKGPDETRVAVVTADRNNNRIEPTDDDRALLNVNRNATNTSQPIPHPSNAPVNEPKEYVKKRYLGSCEAVWRLCSFDITHREPNVNQLPVHLEGKQTVIYKQGNETLATQNASSKLLIYFKRPAGQEFDNLTYEAFYEQYIVYGSRPNAKTQIHQVSDGKHFITKRQRREAIARLYWVTPNRGEQFYLRLLLSVYPCRGYADLLAKGGPDCDTFQHAARHVGLANDEHEYENALQEASQFYTGRKLRNFFVLMITNGAPGAILWDNFKDVLSEDYLERIPNEHRAYHKALLEIDRILRKHGSCTRDHGLPEVMDNTTELGREREDYNTDVPRLCTFVESWLPRLSDEQNQVFHHINHLLHDNNRHAPGAQTAIFIDGASGTGKTILLNVIAAHVRGTLQGVALCTATSGIAALNYEGGCTAHSMFKLPIELNGDTGVWGVTNSSQRGQLIREASVIIFDEAPMCHKYLIHILDRSLRDMMQCPTKPFGGKVIIFAGDFRQIPPVVPSAKCSGDIVEASLRTSTLWSSLLKFSLTQAQRTREDADYSDFLLRLGSGQLAPDLMNNNNSTLNMVSLKDVDVCTELNELLDFVFPTNILDDPDECAKRAILTTHNINVRNINQLILNTRISGAPITLFSIDSVEQELAQEFHLGPDTLNQVQASNVPDHKLVIKIGCVCMIVRNLSFVDRLVNGTKVIVVEVTPRIVTVRKPGDSEIFLIPRITFKTPVEHGSPIEMSRLQFPLQVCYAMTVHKSQGQTIHRVGVDLRSDTFTHGQLYVALGRVRNREHIKVLINENRIIDDVPYATFVLIRQLIEI